MAEPAVRGAALHTETGIIAVGSSAWFDWLGQAERFRYEGPGGVFGARRERMQRGGWYWKAYRRVDGRLRRAYLGRAEDVTAERLERAAAALAGVAPEEPPGLAALALLHTKLELPPPRAGLVVRPELYARLDTALRSRLSLVTAPAGWGKTTLLASWALSVQARGLAQIAWLALDPADDDPTRLWSYTCAALSVYEPGLRAAEMLFRAPRPASPEQLMTILINTIAGPGGRPATPLILILDDIHVLHDPEILAAMTFLVDHLPSRLHLVLAGRSEPALPLARWRAAGWGADLRAMDLRFGPEDSAALLGGVTGWELPADAVSTLVDRTEGWAAGLQLAGLVLRMAGHWTPALLEQISGSHPFILDYLVDEILRRQPPDVQEFLLQTSALDRFCAELCDAVTDADRPAQASERGSSAAMLDYLDRANLFLVPLDTQRRWFRYHQLFANALRAQLTQLSPGRLPLLQRRAMGWYAERAHAGAHEHISPAIEYALAAGAFEEAADLLAHFTHQMLWSSGEVRTVLRWIAELPEAVVRSRPDVALMECWALLATIQFDLLEPRIDRLSAILEEHENRGLYGELLGIRSYATRINGDLPAALMLGHHALELLEPDQLIVRHIVGVNLQNTYLDRGDLRMARQVLGGLRQHFWRLKDYPIIATMAGLDLMESTLLMLEGQARAAEASIRQVLDAVAQRRDGHRVPVGMILVGLGEVRYEQGDLDEAEQCTRVAIQQGAEWWNHDILHAAHYLLARICQARGDQAGALAALARAHELTLAYKVPFITAGVRVSEAWEALGNGELATVERVLAERQISAEGELDRGRYSEYELLARLHLARGRADEAITIVDRLRSLSEAGGCTWRVIAAERITALALRSAGRAEEAHRALDRALELAEPGGLVRCFVEEGEPMRALLREALQRWDTSGGQRPGVPRAYLERLLAAYTASTHARPSVPEQAGWPEQLTLREREVLRLVASGASNQVIAEQLVVSLHTVKKHLTHILAKLGAENRTAAVATARRAGML